MESMTYLQLRARESVGPPGSQWVALEPVTSPYISPEVAGLPPHGDHPAFLVAQFWSAARPNPPPASADEPEEGLGRRVWRAGGGVVAHALNGSRGVALCSSERYSFMLRSNCALRSSRLYWRAVEHYFQRSRVGLVALDQLHGVGTRQYSWALRRLEQHCRCGGIRGGLSRIPQVARLRPRCLRRRWCQHLPFGSKISIFRSPKMCRFFW